MIVTHGRLAFELLNAAQTIEGPIEGIEAVALEWNETVEESHEKIRQALDRMRQNQGVIIFTDMFGGTPSNISLSFLEKDKVEIVTGVNLPMIVKFGSLRNESEDLNSVVHTIREKGAKSIRVASDLLVCEPRESETEA
ncbi:MAG: PTS sugar transporter subunit IIA [Thermoanaerobaculia bacterium]